MTAPASPPRRSRRRFPRWTWWVLGVLAVGGTGLGYGWWWLHRQLAPVIAANLAKSLDRPLVLGPVQRIGWRGVEFGPSSLPPTKGDPDFVKVQGIAVAFDPWHLWQSRTLPLAIFLEKPEVYVQEDRQGRWLTLNLRPQEPGPIRVRVTQVNFRDGKVMLQAAPRHRQTLPPLVVQQFRGQVRDLSDPQTLRFQGQGVLPNQGQLKITGTWRSPGEHLTLAFQTDRLEVQEVEKVVALPLKLSAGQVRGKFALQWQGGKLPQYQGTLQFQGAIAQIAGLPRPFRQGQGVLVFQGQTLTLREVRALYGSIPLTALAGAIDFQKDYNLRAQVDGVTLEAIRTSLQLPPSPLALKGEVGGDLHLSGPLNHPQLAIALGNRGPVQIDRLPFEQIEAQLQFHNNQLKVSQIAAQPKGGGLLTGQGAIRLGQGGQAIFDLRGENLPSRSLAQLYGLNPSVALGNTSGQVRWQTRFQNAAQWQLTGSGQTTWNGQRVTIAQLRLNRQQWQAQAAVTEAPLIAFANQLPRDFQGGRVKAIAQIAGGFGQNFRQSLRGKAQGRFQLPGGVVTISQMTWQGDQYQAQLRTNGLAIAALPQSQLIAQAQVKGRFGDGDLRQLQGQGQGQILLQGQRLSLSQVNWQGGQWRAQLIAQGLNIRPWLPKSLPNLPARLTGKGEFRGDLRQLQPQYWSGQGQGKLQLPRGEIIAQNLTLQRGAVTSAVQVKGLDLRPWTAAASGNLSGKVTVAGHLRSLDLNTWQARGQIALSQGIHLLPRPLTSEIDWRGDRLTLQRISGEGVQGQGTVALRWRSPQPIARYDLTMALRDLPLAPLPIPRVIALAGVGDFQGRIAGTLLKPGFQGKVAIRGLTLGTWAMEPQLTGTLQGLNDQPLMLDLQGAKDRLALQWQPQSFSFQIASRELQSTLTLIPGQQFRLQATGLPLTLARQVLQEIRLPEIDTGAILKSLVSLNGRATGEMQWDFPRRLARGSFTVEQPSYNAIRGDRLSAQLYYADRQLVLQNGIWLQGEQRYDLDGRIALHAGDPDIQGNLKITRGKIADVLALLGIAEWQDLDPKRRQNLGRTVADLLGGFPLDERTRQTLKQYGLISLGSGKNPLGSQLQQFSQLLAQQGQQNGRPAPLPAPKDLQGKFDAQIALNGSLQKGFQATFQLTGGQNALEQGEPWRWAGLTFPQVQVKGNWQKDRLFFQPLRVQMAQGSVILLGSLGGDQQAATLRLTDFPIATVRPWLPDLGGLTVDGLLSVNANLAGDLRNPLAKGQIRLTQALVNQVPVDITQGNFNYEDARLDFALTSLLAAKSDPLKVTGDLPLPLPFSPVRPADDHFNVAIAVENRGLSLLSLLSRGAITWLDGQGQLNLQITGNLPEDYRGFTNLVADGQAKVKGGAVTLAILPNTPITNLNGDIQFDFNTIKVPQLTGQFSGGQLLLSGSLPTARPNPQVPPLNLQIDRLDFLYPQLYQGKVAGDLVIAGSFLQPRVGGNVELSDGQVFLTDRPTVGGTSLPGPKPLILDTQFNKLQLTLGKGVQITRVPILNFLATGDLQLNGTLNRPEPYGTIRLRRGQVNLFAAQFQLAGGYEHRAQFRGTLDPELDLNLLASAVETLRRPLPTDPLSAEILDVSPADVGSLQTIRIQAEVRGLASQLTGNDAASLRANPNIFTLRSSPNRSQTEIVALLGGGFVSTFSGQDSGLGLANLAGSAILGSLQNLIGNSLGLSEFRLFPTLITSDKNRTSTLGLGAEVGVDVSRNISLSAFKIINSSQPLQYGLRYRFNDRLLLRTSSDFKGDNRANLEYEFRF